MHRHKNSTVGSWVRFGILVSICLLGSLAGCGGGTGISQSGTATSGVLSITPPNAQINTGATQQFTALLGGSQTTGGVTWSVGGIAGGNPSLGMISTSGRYTAPGTIPPGGVVEVAATSNAVGNPSASAQLSISTPSADVSVSPAETTVLVGQQEQFSARISGSNSQSVTWSVNGIPNGNAVVGQISVSGSYTAPKSISVDFTATIAAQSVSNPADSGTASAYVTTGLSGAAGCGPPLYTCARTDLSVSPVSTLPSWGNATGAGTQFTDSSFNSAAPIQYARVTDKNTLLNRLNDQFVVADSGSGDENHFNLNETLFTIGGNGGNTYFFNLDPTTMSTGLAWSNPSDAATVGVFSQVNANLYYSFTTYGKIQGFDFSGCGLGHICNPGQPSLIYDFAESCGVSGVLQWHAIGGVGGSDNIFAGSYSTGVQDCASQAVSWNKSTGVCYRYDTLAGTVTSYPGAVLVGSVTTPNRYTIHNVKLDPSGSWLVLIAGNCLTGSCPPNAWNIGTATVKVCVTACGGHFTETAAGWLNNDSRPGDIYTLVQVLFRTWGKFDTSNNADLIPLLNDRPAIPLTWDSHISSKNDLLGEQKLPIFNCMYSPATTIGYPWQSEIVAYSQTNGVTYRFGHSFNSNFESIFQSRACIGAPSSKGNFYLFPSDGEGSFGSMNDGSANCLLGGPPPSAGQNYALHSLITVTTGSDPVFEITTAGISGTGNPVWPSAVGSTLTWGSATFTNRGQSTCRSDVFIMRTQ